MTFYEKVFSLCSENGISITALAEELGFTRSAATTWKNSKSLPRPNTIKLIADYFDVTVEYLSSEKEGLPVSKWRKDEQEDYYHTKDESIRKILYNRYSGVMKYNLSKKEEQEKAPQDKPTELTKDEEMLLSYYRRLAPKNKTMVFNLMKSIFEETKDIPMDIVDNYSKMLG